MLLCKEKISLLRILIAYHNLAGYITKVSVDFVPLIYRRLTNDYVLTYIVFPESFYFHLVTILVVTLIFPWFLNLWRRITAVVLVAVMLPYEILLPRDLFIYFFVSNMHLHPGRPSLTILRCLSADVPHTGPLHRHILLMVNESA